MIVSVYPSFYRAYSFLYQFHQTETVQATLGIASCCLGFQGLHDLLNDYGRFYKESLSHLHLKSWKDWKSSSLKLIQISGNLSLIASALISQPVLEFCKTGLQTLLGHYSFCLIDPKTQLVATYIKHCLHIASIVLGIPSTIKTIYDTYSWIKKKYQKLNTKCHSKIKHTLSKMDIAISVNTLVRGTASAYQFLSDPSTNG